MSIHTLPPTQRPREKLLQFGESSLSDCELLAIILQSGSKQLSALELADQLIEQHDGLQGLFNANFSKLSQFDGIGNAKYCQLKASLELSQRYLKEPLQREGMLHSTQDASQFLTAKLRGFDHEVFACLFLDTQHRVIAFEILFHGSINHTYVHPRIIVQKSLQHNASAIILSHNHPSGNSTPSKADREITKNLFNLLNKIEIHLIDHIIIGANSSYSLADHGLI